MRHSTTLRAGSVSACRMRHSPVRSQRTIPSFNGPSARSTATISARSCVPTVWTRTITSPSGAEGLVRQQIGDGLVGGTVVPDAYLQADHEYRDEERNRQLPGAPADARRHYRRTERRRPRHLLRGQQGDLESAGISRDLRRPPDADRYRQARRCQRRRRAKAIRRELAKFTSRPRSARSRRSSSRTRQTRKRPLPRCRRQDLRRSRRGTQDPAEWMPISAWSHARSSSTPGSARPHSDSRRFGQRRGQRPVRAGDRARRHRSADGREDLRRGQARSRRRSPTIAPPTRSTISTT